MHCGGRLSRERLWKEGGDPATFVPSQVPDDQLDEVLAEGGLTRRSGVSPLTLVWVALLLAGYLYRSCVS
jgi:hypothetical protein